MERSLLQYFTPEEFLHGKGIMSETSSILDSLSDSELSDSVQSGGTDEETPRTSGTTSCPKEAAPSQSKRSVTHKTPDYSSIKPKVCFGKISDAPKSRFGSKKEADLPSADGRKELRKQIVTHKTPDFSKVKPKVCFPKISKESRFGSKKEADLPSADGQKELRKQILTHKTPDFSKVKPKVCFPKISKESRFGADGTKEIRKRPLHHKTPDYSQVKPQVRFPKNSYTPPKSRFGVKESDLHSSSSSVKESDLRSSSSVKESDLRSSSVKESDLRSSSSVKESDLRSSSVKESDLRSSSLKEATLCQDDGLLLRDMFNKLLMKHLAVEDRIEELRLRAEDHIVSAETHAGFVSSSESCLTPPAPPGPLHQRAPERYDWGDVLQPRPQIPVVPTSSERGAWSEVRGQPETSGSVGDSLDRAIRQAEELISSCCHLLDSVRDCRQLLRR